MPRLGYTSSPGLCTLTGLPTHRGPNPLPGRQNGSAPRVNECARASPPPRFVHHWRYFPLPVAVNASGRRWTRCSWVVLETAGQLGRVHAVPVRIYCYWGRPVRRLDLSSRHEAIDAPGEVASSPPNQQPERARARGKNSDLNPLL